MHAQAGDGSGRLLGKGIKAPESGRKQRLTIHSNCLLDNFLQASVDILSWPCSAGRGPVAKPCPRQGTVRGDRREHSEKRLIS